MSLSTRTFCITFPSGDTRASESSELPALAAVSTVSTLSERLTPNPDPEPAFSALATVCVPNLGDECTIELVEEGQAPYRLIWRGGKPDAVQRAEVNEMTSSPTTRQLLHSGEPILLNDLSMSVAIVGVSAGDSDYLGAITCTRYAGPFYTAVDARVLQSLVERTVAMIRRSRAERQRLAVATTKIDNLEIALAGARDIGVAIGIVMATEGCSRNGAFERLRDLSQATNRKLRDIATEIVDRRVFAPQLLA
jgi:hypothetical protein